MFYMFFKKISHSINKIITCRANNSTEINIVEVRCKFGFLINQSEDDGEEDYEVPLELSRHLEHEEKEI